ncbi:MAG: methionyl-tRNA formyltransferase, partial [Parcubacteria group bacterium]|nr:methionyl-tRNA formyltransferase [Parcubacteria group bacterium]
MSRERNNQSQPVRILFMGSSSFGLRILEACREIGDVVGVVTQPARARGRHLAITPSPIVSYAHTHGIPVYQPEHIRSREAVAALRPLAPDFIVVAAYGQIIPEELLRLPRYGALNVHASLLPRWRGASPIQHAILSGDEKTGVTIICMDEKLDHGPILAQESHALSPADTAESLEAALADLGAALLKKIVPLAAAGRVKPQPQDENIATYAPRLKREDGKIQWEKDAEMIERQIRAFYPWPGSW